ncbi:UNKNOWN [Stylonychia lemnae]|uniref:Uncharacterized protein n=1 Tax=Stylonychia lemnae TaxID=5949 RepID=A0A078A245_STYLE|nr:UNKNOWN [Stylonychia lemnae]|eukprot:CDW76210.1 UNKNOWN [Stylonychia lemnae]
MDKMKLFDKISIYLDPIFAVVLIGLGALRIYEGLYDSTLNLLLLAYYFFFAIILLMTICFKKVLYKYMGFLKGDFCKALFYIFLAILIFADYHYWVNVIVGIVMGTAAIFNLIRFLVALCDKKEQGEQQAASSGKANEPLV